MAKRGKTPSLISGSSGKPSPEIAKKKRKCTRCGEAIIMGDNIFEIPKLGTGYSNKRPFCRPCFKKILDQTRSDLDKIDAQWEQGGSD